MLHNMQVYGPEKGLPYVVPSPNVRIECPLALVDRVLDSRPAAAREAAHAFGKFLFTPEAQVSAMCDGLLRMTLVHAAAAAACCCSCHVCCCC
jgi:ABC-type sulfate transport system substrate-binding protein